MGTGVHGVLERYTSARALGVRAKEELAKQRAKGVTKSTLAIVKDVTAKDVFEHAATGDKLAQELVDQTVEYLAVAFINACRHFEPQMIVVSGGMALAGEALLEPLRQRFAQRWWKIQPLIRIVPATAGNHVGVIGAAAAAKLRYD